MMEKAELSKYISYNPITGEFRRIGKKDRWGNFYVIDRPLSTVNTEGYIVVRINNKLFKVHRLAFILMDEELSDDQEVDHVDGNRANNKWKNLRSVSRSINMTNKGVYKNNSTGAIGVCKYGDMFRARINVDGVRISLGLFNTIEEAAKVRLEAEKKHGYHINHGDVR